MNKEQFLSAMCYRLQGVSSLERQKTVDYYAEMIDDRIEDGMSEEDAVAAMGDVDEILKDYKVSEPAKKPMSGGRLAVILSLSPISVVLLIAAYSIIWSLVIVYYAVIVSLFSAMVCLSALAFRYFATLSVYEAILFFGGAFVCLGLAQLFCIAARFVGRFAVRATKFLWRLAFGKEVLKHE